MTTSNSNSVASFKTVRDNFAEAAFAWVVTLDSDPHRAASASPEMQRCRALAALAGLAADETDPDHGEGLSSAWVGSAAQSMVAIETIDSIADQSWQGIELASQALAQLPADQTATREMIVAMQALFRNIGCAADTAAADSTADLTQIWAGMTATPN